MDAGTDAERPIVEVSEGKLRGCTLRSVLGPSYYAFKGIPFAAPPIGPLRFKPPQPPAKWDGVRDASSFASAPCVQHKDDGSGRIAGSEDCLYLNVYARRLAPRPETPVMVFVHGGSFVEGTVSRDIYRQDYLVTRDVVLVFFNYRIGPLGFLSLGHEVASGNVGLRDVLFALEWVQRNVAAFGGDPNNVTVFGSSCGAVITHLLTLLPKSKGLMHKAIIQSGVCPLVRTLTSKFDIKNGFRIAARLGLSSQDPVEVIEFLRSVPAERLVECEDHVLSREEAVQYEIKAYDPIIDVDYTSDPVIPGTVEELKRNDADLPMIIGHTSDESLLCFVDKFTDETYEYYNDNLESLIKLKLKDPARDLARVTRDVREFYLKNRPIDRDSAWNLIRLTSDFFVHADRKVIDDRNEHARAPTYVYNFSYLGAEPTIYQTDHGPQPLEGVAHGDELSYLFYLAYMPARKERPDELYPREETQDRLILERLVRMWSNFAATGNPTPETDDEYLTTVWKPSSRERLYYLDIGRELALRDDRESESRAFYERNRECFAKY